MTRPWWPAEPSSVATARAGAAAPRPRRAPRRGSRAGPSPGRRARPARSPAGRCRRRRRRGRAARPSRGGAKPRPSGPSSQTSSPGRSSQSRSVPGPTSSSRKSSVPSAVAPGDGERARQERPLVGAPAPALGGGEHGELAGVRRGPVRVGDRQHDVGAVASAARPPAAGGGRTARASGRAHGATAPAPLARWISWSERTSGTDPVALGGDRPRRGHAAGHRRDAGDAARDRRAADLVAVRARGGARRRVDDEHDVAALDLVDDVRRALAELVEPLDRDAHAADRARRAAGGGDLEAEVVQLRGDRPDRGLVASRSP